MTLTDRASLRPAFRDAYGVFSVQNTMTGGVDGEILQGRNVGEAGVAHFVYASGGIGAARTVVGSWDSKLAVQAHLGTLSLPLTVLRPMAFMELMTDKAPFPAVAARHLMPTLVGADVPIGWIRVDDVGAVAARVFGDPGRYIGADLRLAADIQSIAGCRQIWREVTGRPPRRFPMHVWLFKRFTGTDLITMWRRLSTANINFDVAPSRAILPGARTVQQWLKQQQGLAHG